MKKPFLRDIQILKLNMDIITVKTAFGSADETKEKAFYLAGMNPR